MFFNKFPISIANSKRNNKIENPNDEPEPLLNKVLFKSFLSGKFRESTKTFQPLKIILQIISIQLAYWSTILCFQGLLLTVPTFFLMIFNIKFNFKYFKNAELNLIYPSFDLLFSLKRISIGSIENFLNCICFIISGFIR